MKQLNLRLSKEKKALHLKIADAIRLAITKGQIKPGEKLPSARVLADQLGISRQTIMTGFEDLIAEGWVISLPRKGYLVADNLSLQFVHKKSQSKKTTTDTQFDWPWKLKIDLGTFQPTEEVRFNFQSGLPDLSLFPKEEFHYYLSKALKKSTTELLDYGSPQGIKPLLKAIDTCLRRVKNIVDRTTIITHGSQEAIYLTIQLLVRPGDTVAIEDPGYPPVRELLKSVGVKILPIEMDSGGIVPDRLEELAKKSSIRLLFLTPLHQFPTTVTLSAPRRLQIYEIAKKYGVVILEDDYDHEFHYLAQPLPPMASDDPYGQIVYLGTLSKLMFPGARLGFMSVPNSFAHNFLQYRRLVTHANDSLMQQALAGWIVDGGFERHMNRMRRVYEKRLVAMEDSLEKLRGEGKKISWNKPDGGMALWLNTNRNSATLAKEALAKKIFVTPEDYYCLGGQKGTHLRLGFSNQTEEDIQLGLAALGKLL